MRIPVGATTTAVVIKLGTDAAERRLRGRKLEGGAQPRSRASSPGETPAGNDCPKTCAARSSRETPAGDDCPKNLFVHYLSRETGELRKIGRAVFQTGVL